MIPRIEQKLEFNKNQYMDLLKWLRFKKAKIIYPERIICSRYLDTINCKMYNDTLEGIVPRKKIRIRTYGSFDFLKSKSPYSLEIKMTREHQRLKKTFNNIEYNSLINDGYYDKKYGFCYEKVDVSYNREYYLVDDIRVTIDKDIQYNQINLNKISSIDVKYEKNYVLEIKTDIKKNLTFLLNNFDFPRSRFSKYERAIQSFI